MEPHCANPMIWCITVWGIVGGLLERADFAGLPEFIASWRPDFESRCVSRPCAASEACLFNRFTERVEWGRCPAVPSPSGRGLLRGDGVVAGLWMSRLVCEGWAGVAASICGLEGAVGGGKLHFYVRARSARVMCCSFRETRGFRSPAWPTDYSECRNPWDLPTDRRLKWRGIGHEIGGGDRR